MTYPDTLELTIESMAQGGEGVGRWNERVVFVDGGLPGEQVQVRVTQQKPNFARGVVVTVLDASPDRVAPRLPGADHMPWQHIAYPAQLRFKQAILAEQLAKIAELTDPPVAPMLAAAHPWGYRNTARLHIEDGTIGYHAAGTNHVVDLSADPLLLPVLNDALAGLRTLLGSAPAGLSSVSLRASSAYGYVVAALQADGATGDLAPFAARWQSQTPALAGVAYDNHPAHLHDEIAGVVFALSTESFFQIHTAQAEQLVAIVQSGLALEPGARLLDAYSGVGTFALPLARHCAEVVAVEENAVAVRDGDESAARNGIGNVRFVVGAVERVLPTLDEPFDAVVLDPPRRGCHPAVLDALVAALPPRIVYVSCHPGTLSRDLRPLLAAGYTVQAVQPVDLFPQTPHIESIVLLRR